MMRQQGHYVTLEEIMLLIMLTKILSAAGDYRATKGITQKYLFTCNCPRKGPPLSLSLFTRFSCHYHGAERRAGRSSPLTAYSNEMHFRMRYSEQIYLGNKGLLKEGKPLGLEYLRRVIGLVHDISGFIA